MVEYVNTLLRAYKSRKNEKAKTKKKKLIVVLAKLQL
jgi:hypothetical protein